MLELRRINKYFNLDGGTSVHVLKDISFKLPNKGLFFIVGKSGCGKTTLLNLIEGTLLPTHGEILLNGKNICEYEEKERNEYLRNDISIVFQNYDLIENLTVNENLSIARNIIGDKNIDIDTKLKELLIYEKKDSIVNTLSGGEKQRVGIIRGLIKDPKIMVCDEPTGSLDEKNGVKVMEILKKVSADRLVIVVTHNESLIKKYSDGFIRMEDGRLVDSKIKIKDQNNNTIKKNKRRTKYNGFELFKYRFKNIAKKNILSLLSLFVGFLLVFLSLSFYIGLSNSMSTLEDNFADNNIFKVSQLNYQESGENKIQVVKKIRPKIETINNYFVNFQTKKLLLSLDYILSSNIVTSYSNTPFDNVSYSFYVENSEGPNIYINNVFKNSYLNDIDIIGKSLNINIKKNVEYYNESEAKIIEEEVVITDAFRVLKIKDQFQFLNNNHVYLPYSFFIDKLKNLNLKKISNSIGEITSFYNLLINGKNDSEFSSYCYYLHIDRSEVPKMYDEMNLLAGKKNSIITIENNPHTVANSLREIMSLLFDGIIYFVIIIVVCNAFLLGFLAYASYNKSRKDVAILKSLGAKKSSINNYFVIEQLFIVIFAFSLSLLVYFSIQNSVSNILFSYFAIPNVLVAKPTLIITILLAICTLVYCVTKIPLLFSKNVNIAKELKES